MRFFSVIIPLFNKVEYIERCLQSVIGQSYQAYEVIVVNDGSTDGGEIKVQAYQNETINLISQINQGVSVARNNGVNQSKYDFVVFLDADDTWADNFLYELNNLIDHYPQAGIYGINHFYKYENGKTTSENYDRLFNGQTSGILKDYFKIFAKLGKSPFSNSGCCFPKGIFNKVGGYKPGIKTTEDSDLWCRIALTSEVAFHIIPLVTYYLETPNNTRQLMDFHDHQVSITLQEYLSANKVPKEYIQSINELIASFQLDLVKKAILTGHNKYAIRKLFDKRLLSNYPINSLLLFCVALVPSKLFFFFIHLSKKIS